MLRIVKFGNDWPISEVEWRRSKSAFAHVNVMAAMVSNLMVVLCGDQPASPVVNTGTLYS